MPRRRSAGKILEKSDVALEFATLGQWLAWQGVAAAPHVGEVEGADSLPHAPRFEDSFHQSGTARSRDPSR